jgi:hypothetical protein
MKLLPFSSGLGALGLSLIVGCASHTSDMNRHWSERSIGPRVSRAFLTYDWEKDGSYRDFAWQKKQDINLTVRRHFFNNNPENPFQPGDESFYAPRPPNSLLPRPWNYIHLEGLATGAILYAAGGMFVPIPIDSIIGTLEEGGDEEFMQGIGQTFRPIGVVTASFMHDALGFPETQGDAWRH